MCTKTVSSTESRKAISSSITVLRALTRETLTVLGWVVQLNGAVDVAYRRTHKDDGHKGENGEDKGCGGVSRMRVGQAGKDCSQEAQHGKAPANALDHGVVPRLGELVDKHAEEEEMDDAPCAKDPC